MDYFHTTSFDELDVYWIVLTALGIFMFMASLVTTIVLWILWRRYQTSNTVPVQIPLPNYETQRMEIFVPPDENDTTQGNFGEFRARGTLEDGIQRMQQFYPRTNRAYF